MNGPRSSLLQLTMQDFPMKEAIDLIFVGAEQLGGVPSTGHKNKNDFSCSGDIQHVQCSIFY